MNTPFPQPMSPLDRRLKPEEMDQILNAILSGKYSWACVLILRFAGYNPLHYIPYRTYNRLIKDSIQPKSSSKNQASDTIQKIEKSVDPEVDQASFSDPNRKSLHQIRDLSYLEPVHERHQVVGGHGLIWVNNWLIG